MSVRYVYWLRHATAQERSPLLNDIDRCLVDKGRAQAIRAGLFLSQQQIEPSLILSSPYPRAVQTAELCRQAAQWPATELRDVEWLAHLQPIDKQFLQLEQLLPELPLQTLVVGHEPEMSGLLGRLLNCQPATLRIRKGSLLCLTVQQTVTGAQWQLQWMLPAKFLR